MLHLKDLVFYVSGLESTLADCCVSVDSKGGYRRIFREFLQVLILNSLRRKRQMGEISPRNERGAEEAFVPDRQGTLFPSRDERIVGAMERPQFQHAGSRLFRTPNRWNAVYSFSRQLQPKSIAATMVIKSMVIRPSITLVPLAERCS